MAGLRTLSTLLGGFGPSSGARLNDPNSSGGDLRFSYDSPALTITPPPASIVLNRADYGF